ncbi:heterokaryon incompatibility protein-domain-containing protein [Phaeosphaeria sp. MPI-PUGE-AT-0046c]|nr:heterokaryon incompatibility protein-domain-containing protein [Phaeosphaeria sp. MPI-PUGE-AT-0046c]
MTQFAYTPLEAPESSIRSLEVFPDEEDGPVKVQLSEHKTPLTDRYRCLSYMWGPPSDDAYNIIVNDCVFRVRNNLYHFLRMAGKRFPHTPLWIDAVCINQEDDTEKGIQVSRMSNIYAMAVETLIWLGDDAEVSSALEWLDTPPWDWSSNAAFASLEKLYVDPYWTRMWYVKVITS